MKLFCQVPAHSIQTWVHDADPFLVKKNPVSDTVECAKVATGIDMYTSGFERCAQRGF